MSCRVEIVSVGNELLIGKVANTNAQWLAQRLASLGVAVTRIIVVEDSVDDISKALEEVLDRKPSFLIVTGGLGPTFDDMTLQGVSDAVHIPLRANRQALRMIKEKVGIGSAKNEGRLGQAYEKMAVLPRGSKPIPNPVGLAPGVRLKVRGVELVCLPGVPQEMKAIFDQSVFPDILRLSGAKRFHESSLRISGIGEPEVAPLIDATMRDNPYVYVKSHPKLDREGIWIELHLSTVAETAVEGETRISRAVERIRSLVQLNGGLVGEILAKSSEDET